MARLCCFWGVVLAGEVNWRASRSAAAGARVSVSFRFPLPLSLSLSLPHTHSLPTHTHSLSLSPFHSLPLHVPSLIITLIPVPHSLLSQISPIRMVDPAVKGSEGEDANPNSNNNEQHKKTCADCGTTKTPLWRGGPAGPKSLCNACGIRSRKKKRAILGISKGNNNNNNEDGRKGKRNSNGGSSKVVGDSFGLKKRLLSLGREVLMQRSHWKKLKEEEQAAVLLMSLSYGSVYA
ncbi:hypothetical protein RJT34_32289 [Clitoria ternatea]|uniref:GATA-type domain-containing protein n=1 Tax=Clitoria ternatea TaxID=43366 RepID=A0AAN9EX54_CLITE